MAAAQYLAKHWQTPVRRRVIGIIAANFAFFAALLFAMFYLRNISKEWPVPFEFASLLMVTGMSMFAICAGITAAAGAHQADQNETEPAVRWVAIAITCWLTFLFLELVEWVNLIYMVKLGPRTPFGSTFFVLTGAHWIAVTVCVCWFMFVANDVRRRDILASALYSHFLAFWWIVLVVALYLPNSQPMVGL